MSIAAVLAGAQPWTIVQGDSRTALADIPGGVADCCVTSPPYWGLRDYGHEDQLGLEPTPDEYVEALVGVMREVRRVLRDDGTLWLNLGDSYAAANGQALRGGAPSESSTLAGTGHRGGGPKLHAIAPTRKPRPHQSFRRDREPVGGTRHRAAPALKPKDLVGIPWRVAFALQSDGWWLRQDIIWHKPNPMPESVEDRCTKAHEYVFLLSKSERYFYDAKAIAEEGTGRAPGNKRAHKFAARLAAGDERHRTAAGLERIREGTETRNRRDVWTVATTPFHGAHFAVMPCALAEPCILAGSRGGGLVIDPFCGAGTVGVVARRHGRGFIGIELAPANVKLGSDRIEADAPLLNVVPEMGPAVTDPAPEPCAQEGLFA